MGIKFLSLHTIPWCFHLMGTHIACVQHLPHPDPPLHTVQVVHSDGHVQIYHQPVAAAELMLQFPKHLICRSDSFFIGQKIPALAATDRLQPGHKYFLLPSHVFQSVLSFVTIASFATPPSPAPHHLAGSKAAFVKKAATCRPFDIHRSPSGLLQIRISDEFITSLIQEGGVDERVDGPSKPKGRVCTTPELEKDYSSLIGCRRSREWRPKLETIKEKDQKHRAFGMKKKKQQQQHRDQDAANSRGSQKNQKLQVVEKAHGSKGRR